MTLEQKQIYKFILLEVRPRLQSINVFITLIKDEKIKIVLEIDSFNIVSEYFNLNIPCEGLKIVPDSLSSFKINDKSVTFRLATTNNLSEQFGGFKTELLQNSVVSSESLSKKPFLMKDVAYVIKCLNCEKSLGDSLKFNRILPLPSDNSDPSDWFCHAHGNQNAVSLEPKETDIFYTHCFVHVKSNNVPNVRKNDKVIACKYCLSWLGTATAQSGTSRLWLNCVRLSHGTSTVSTAPMTDVFQSIKDVLKHSLYNSFKIMLCCQSSAKEIDSILMWMLEKRLQVRFDGSGEMKKYDVGKVLFRYCKSSDDVFGQWQNDSLVSVVNVSKPMFVELLQYLYKFNKILPREFSKSNDFNVSYLFMYDQVFE